MKILTKEDHWLPGTIMIFSTYGMFYILSLCINLISIKIIIGIILPIMWYFHIKQDYDLWIKKERRIN